MLFSQSLVAQDLNQHHWKDRLLLVLTDELDSDRTKQQIDFFEKAKAEYAERKLKVYLISPKTFSLLNNSKTGASTVFSEYASQGKDFEILLIGLDGGIKLRQNDPIQNAKLFAIIDGMPMRRTELRSRGKK